MADPSSTLMIHTHLRWDPETHTASNLTQPHHEILLKGAIEILHGLFGLAWMNEE
jgi:hypothetical protein